MRSFFYLLIPVCILSFAFQGMAQPYFQATAVISGNGIVYKIKAVNGNITCGWSDIEFFFRNNDALPVADGAFAAATISVNTTDFPGVSIPYNGMNIQGSETNYNNYWLGISFTPTAPKTYNQNQEYIICTITLASSPSGYDFELCHNEPNFSPHYVVLTDEGGNDWTSPSGINKFYGPGAYICEPDNCPANNPGNNHILPLNGPTPVELLAFQAKKHDAHTALLEWNTANEINFAAFEIERQSGSAWEKIGLEAAKAEAGNGAAYQFFDRHPPVGKVYYRLKMVDFDGTYAYSPIRQLRFENQAMLQLAPNPTRGDVSLLIGAGMREEEMLVELHSADGKKIMSRLLVVSPGSKHTLLLHEYQLPAGVYFFRASTPGGYGYSELLVVQPEN